MLKIILWCGNIYSTSECNHETFKKIHVQGIQKAVLAAMLEGKNMPFNLVANTNHTCTTLLKNQSAIKCLP